MFDRLRTLVLSESIEIAAAPDAVWRVFTGLEDWASWNTVCRSASWTHGAPWAVGSGFKMVLRMARAPVPFNVRIVEWDPPNTVAWDSTVLTITGHRRFMFRPVRGSGACEVVDTKSFSSSVLPIRVFYPRPVIQAMSREWLRSLKIACESGRA